MQTITMQKMDIAKSLNKSFAICIANISNKTKILDLKPCEWLKNELKDFPTFVFDLKQSDNLREILKLYIKNFDNFLLIYSNTPLITKNLVKHLQEYVSIKSCDFCKLPNGFVANTKYFLSNDKLSYDSIYTQNLDEFVTIETEKDLFYATKVLNNRLINYHKNNGVIFKDAQSVHISYNTKIGRGSVIFSNCNLIGKTVIGDNCIINNNTTINSSKIGDNTSISNSIVEKSTIGNNVVISPYCNIVDKSKIGDNCYIDYYTLIKSYTIKKNTKLDPRTTLEKTEKK